ncbi:hypothetical protein ACLB2K_018103 [Fragaria x ananassa]
MEVVQILHMNKGNGEASYAQNSKVQNKILTIAKPIIEEALLKLLGSNNDTALDSMGIADLGCSSGPNTLLLISEIMDVIRAKLSSGLLHPSSSSMEFRVFLNDLFRNDFNTVFMSLPAFHSKLKEDDRYKRVFGANPNLFISAVPGSFYGRLFPRNSLHFVHSSSSLHWLSQVPPSLDSTAGTALNKGKIYISKSSPQCVLDAYSLQFHKDFSMFLKSRAEEIVGGGRMVLSFMGRPTLDPTTEQSCYQWELLALALMSMVSDGLVEEEKVDSFNAPYYAPCAEELKSELQKDGSFIMDRLEAFEIDWDGGADDQAITMNSFDPDQMVVRSGKRVSKTIRAVVESMIEAHFGIEIMDDLFRRYAELVTKHLLETRTKYINLCKILSITKPIIEETILKILDHMPISFGIADLGCSSGPNSMLLISEVMDVIHAEYSRLSQPSLQFQSSTLEFRVFLNDLFSNDFNTIFMSLPEFYNKFKQDFKGTTTREEQPNIFISAVPGSFYGRLFPTNSLHFVHSSSSLHWLSQVPPGLDTALNKGKIYISKSSPECVFEAYSQQFQKDFSVFLKSRAEEIVSGGRMVLSFMGRRCSDPTTEESCYLQWELLAQALMTFVLEGSIEEEKVESFHAPYYAPCPEELNLVVQKEGSFVADRLEAFEIDWDGGVDLDENTDNITKETIAISSGERVAKTIRAVVESMLESHFGEDLMVDALFQRYAELVSDRLSKSRTKYSNLVISLIKK